MKPLLGFIIFLVLVGFGYELQKLHRAEQADQKKLKDDEARLEQLNHNLQESNQALNSRRESIDKQISDKKAEIARLEQQLKNMDNHDTVALRKSDAAAYLKKEKDKVAAIQADIKTMDSQRGAVQGGMQTARQSLDANFHQRDAQLVERIRLEQDTLNQMTAAFAQFKLDKRDPSSVDQYNTSKRAIDIQKNVVAGFKQQRADLNDQHKLATDNINLSSTDAKNSLDMNLAIRRQDLAAENRYLDQATKSYNEAAKLANNESGQVKSLQERIQALRAEIHELEMAR